MKRESKIELPEKSFVEVVVKDDGIGIPIEEQPEIFERFYRGASDRHGDRASKGFSLGLALVRAIVESPGGTIRIESAPSLGACFVILLALPKNEADVDSQGSRTLHRLGPSAK